MRYVLISLVGLAVLGPAASVSAAAPASVTIDSLKPELTKADDGSWTAALKFTNPPPTKRSRSSRARRRRWTDVN